MTTNWYDDEPRAPRAASVLPIMRAALARGEGPPAVLAWVRAQGEAAGRRTWAEADEARARVLAVRLASRLGTRLRAGAGTGRAAATVGG